MFAPYPYNARYRHGDGDGASRARLEEMNSREPVNLHGLPVRTGIRTEKAVVCCDDLVRRLD
jgi:uncharacterized protein (UPF0276 family)